jgi:hypothetical protein
MFDARTSHEADDAMSRAWLVALAGQRLDHADTESQMPRGKRADLV